MSTQIQFRRDTAANWTANNPTLAPGEVGLETDTNSYKIGDGSTSWTSLGYHQLAPEITTLLMDGQSSDASAPASGNLVVYSKAIAGRMMLKQAGPSGLTTALQPFLARNKVGYWCPPGSATTVPGVFGFTAYTAVTAAVTRNITVTNLFNRMRRLGFPSSATAANAAGARVPYAQVTLGDGAGNGGFYKIIRWGISDTVFKTNCRTFIGVSSSTIAPTNVEPSTLTNVIGMGHGAADSYMQIYSGGSAAQSAINLGANFPANTSNIDVYELALFSPSNQLCTVYYEVTRVNTGNVVTGILSDGTGVTLPASSTLLTYSQNWRNNNTNSYAVSFDIMSDYIETDN